MLLQLLLRKGRVRGHWRKLASGRRIWVREHYTKRQKRSVEAPTQAMLADKEPPPEEIKYGRIYECILRPEYRAYEEARAALAEAFGAGDAKKAAQTAKALFGKDCLAAQILQRKTITVESLQFNDISIASIFALTRGEQYKAEHYLLLCVADAVARVLRGRRGRVAGLLFGGARGIAYEGGIYILPYMLVGHKRLDETGIFLHIASVVLHEFGHIGEQGTISFHKEDFSENMISAVEQFCSRLTAAQLDCLKQLSKRFYELYAEKRYVRGVRPMFTPSTPSTIARASRELRRLTGARELLLPKILQGEQDIAATPPARTAAGKQAQEVLKDEELRRCLGVLDYITHRSLSKMGFRSKAPRPSIRWFIAPPRNKPRAQRSFVAQIAPKELMKLRGRTPQEKFVQLVFLAGRYAANYAAHIGEQDINGWGVDYSYAVLRMSELPPSEYEFLYWVLTPKQKRASTRTATTRRRKTTRRRRATRRAASTPRKASAAATTRRRKATRRRKTTRRRTTTQRST